MQKIPISRWGPDHWSTLAYFETLAVDGGRGGVALPDRDRMRTDRERHPHLVGMTGDGVPPKPGGYPTRLAGGEALAGHDDWDCARDAVAEGLLVDVGTGLQPAFRFTELGRRVVAKLRAHKQAGGGFSNFAQGAP